MSGVSSESAELLGSLTIGPLSISAAEGAEAVTCEESDTNSVNVGLKDEKKSNPDAKKLNELVFSLAVFLEVLTSLEAEDVCSVLPFLAGPLAATFTGLVFALFGSDAFDPASVEPYSVEGVNMGKQLFSFVDGGVPGGA